MAKKKKGKEREVKTARVSFDIVEDAIKEIDSALATGLYGTKRSHAVDRLFREALEARRERGDYDLLLKIEGFGGYALQRYAALTGSSEENVLEHIVNYWVSKNYSTLAEAGIGLQSPEWQKYLEKHGKKKRR